MREAIGGSQLLLIVVTLVIVIMLLLAGSIGYSKAFKTRNSILNIVQKNGGYNISAAKVLVDSNDEIGTILNDIGYNTRIGSNRNCTDRSDSRKLASNGYEVEKSTDYNFCIYHYTEENGDQYYGVETYMYFELPIFGSNDMFVIPMYSESYVFRKKV